MDSTKLLHDEIFGASDSEDDEEDKPKLSFAEVQKPAAAATEDDDGRMGEILESNNNLLIGGGKKGKEKEKKKRATGGASKRASRDEPKQKRSRLQQAGEGGEGGEDGEGGEGAVPAGDLEDPDEDSGSGSEAIEEGAKNDFERVMQRMKAKRGGLSFSREKLLADVQELMGRMEAAYQADNEAVEKKEPAFHKTLMLSDVVDLLRKKQYHEVLIDHGMLVLISKWLHPMSDGNLVSLEIRTALLAALLRLDIDDTVLGALKSSRLGLKIKLLSLHKRETKENKRMSVQLIEKWSRPIFQTSDKVQAKDLPVAAVPRRPRVVEAEESSTVFGAPSGPQTGNHARVPRPMGMDFAMLPESEAKSLPSTKYGKESVKGKLSDRILHGKRKTVAQAVTLSVEGRTLDRL